MPLRGPTAIAFALGWILGAVPQDADGGAVQGGELGMLLPCAQTVGRCSALPCE